MANFWDLPEAVRKKIYRLHLIQNDRITLRKFGEFCRSTRGYEKAMPSLFRVGDKVQREASDIYFGENTFEVARPQDIKYWLRRLFPHHLKLVRSIVLKEWAVVRGGSVLRRSKCDADFKRLMTFKSLQCLTVMVDEKAVLHALIKEYENIKWHISLGSGPQINLQLLYVNGMAGFRSIRGIRMLEFLQVGTSITKGTKQLGSIVGGLLETTIRQEVMLPRVHKPYIPAHKFRFLDLPAEVRNIIYGLLLTFPGPTYPINGLPTSVLSQHAHMRHTKRATLPVPWSSLAMLCTNRQIHKEAEKIFYHDNELVFPHPNQLWSFISTLGPQRLSRIRSVTLFDNIMKPEAWKALIMMHRLPGLRKFHLLNYFEGNDGIPIPASAGYERYPAHLGYEELFKLRNVTDIAVRHLQAEDWKSKPRRPSKVADEVSAVWRHFNHGLQMAQKGMVNKQLYQHSKWYSDELWPVLDGSDCGVNKGCTCGQSEDPSE